MCAETGSPPRFVVSLKDVAEKLDETMDCWEQYLNIFTGEFEAISDGAYIETDMELAAKIEASSDYVRLPNQYELHEYRIMEDFTESLSDARKQERLSRALNGRKPYRHFKDAIMDVGVDGAYYAFRSRAFLEIARVWCEDNGIPYQPSSGNERG